jgi:hypothetical protein
MDAKGNFKKYNKKINEPSKNGKDETGDNKMGNFIATSANCNNEIYENICEWDAISTIFQKAIQKKGMSKKQVKDMIKQIKL